MTLSRKYISDFCGIDSLRLEKPDEASQLNFTNNPTGVVVRIHSVSLNYRDYEVISGLYTHHKMGPHKSIVPCSDFGGEVATVGNSVTRFRKGDRVMSIFNTGHVAGEITEQMLRDTGLGLPLEGVLQEYRVFDESSLVSIPKGLTYAEGSTLPIAAGTAWTSLFGNYKPLRPGQTVLILGTGGVSIFALQIASLFKAKTIITSSSDTKLEFAKKLGAPI